MGKVTVNNEILTENIKKRKDGIEHIFTKFPSKRWSRSGFHSLGKITSITVHNLHVYCNLAVKAQLLTSQIRSRLGYLLST